MTPRTLALVQCVLGIGALCAMDAVVKYLSFTYAVEYVTFLRFVAGGLLAAIVWNGQGRPPLTRDMWPAHLLRGLIVAGMALSFFWGITQMPLADAITIVFIAPLMVPFMARLLLGEALSPRAVLAGVIGFAGALISVQGAPDSNDLRLWAIAALLFSAVSYALSVIILRARAARDGAVRITLLSNLVPGVLLVPAAHGQPLPPETDLLWVLLLGLLSNLGVQLLARAYVQLEAQVSAAMEFSALPWAAVIGYLAFAEAVRPQVWLGALVILAGVWLASTGADRQSSP
jgi:S-adenosylmethionine uptake transporter